MSCRILQVDHLSSPSLLLPSACAEIGISMLCPVSCYFWPSPGWSGCELHVSLCIIIHIIIFVLLLAVLVARLGKRRKPRLSSGALSSVEIALVLATVAGSRMRECGHLQLILVLPGVIPGSVDTKRGCKHEGSLGHGKNIFKLTFIYYFILKQFF